jgi:hypothetical protein
MTDPVISATYLCASCGEVASTVSLIPPGQPDPGPSTSMILGSAFPDRARLSIDGGPVSVTYGFVPEDSVAAALESGDPSALYAINFEYTPFWCPSCGVSYCDEHYRSWITFDDGFYDATYGECPQGHERMLDD